MPIPFGQLKVVDDDESTLLIYPPVQMSTHLTVCPFIYQPTYSIYLPTYPSSHLFYTPFHSSIYLSVKSSGTIAISGFLNCCYMHVL